MARWTCPQCDREFGRTRQSHVCVPGCTVETTFAERPRAQREIFDVLLAHVQTLGTVHVDAVQVGVFLKVDRTLAEVRPKSRWLSLELVLPRVVDHPRISRTMRTGGDLTIHVVRLTAVTDVDADVRDWLTEAYDRATA